VEEGEFKHYVDSGALHLLLLGEFKHYVDSGALHLLLLDSGEGACLPTARTLCHAPTRAHPHVTRSGNPPPKHKHQHKHLLCSPGPRLGRSIHRCCSAPAHPHTAARCTHKPAESTMVSVQHAHSYPTTPPDETKQTLLSQTQSPLDRDGGRTSLDSSSSKPMARRLSSAVVDCCEDMAE